MLIYQADDKPKLLNESRALATPLLSDTDGAVAKKVRRIDVVKATLPAEEGLRLECVFSTSTHREPHAQNSSSSTPHAAWRWPAENPFR